MGNVGEMEGNGGPLTDTHRGGGWCRCLPGLCLWRRSWLRFQMWRCGAGCGLVAAVMAAAAAPVGAGVVLVAAAVHVV